ncbi:MAG TPA: molybdate ABC transporter permease subunit [Holophagaceae bacterium]|jgi:molybdate transport system permease protein|nr:molybdate ABC transporter permease subunit [Holophagaceae bacterium]
MDWQAIRLSLLLAITVVLLLAPIAILLAALLAFGRFRGKAILDALVTLPLVLPPTVLGFYLLVALGPQSFIGRFWTALTGQGLVFSFSGLVVASLLLNLPFFVQPLASALAGVEGRYLETAATLGAGPIARVWRIALPLAWRGLVSGAVLSFAHTMGEFGVVLMVGGDLPGRTRTASIAVFDQVQSLDLAGAHRTAIFLVALAFGVLTAVALLKSARRSWSF